MLSTNEFHSLFYSCLFAAVLDRLVPVTYKCLSSHNHVRWWHGTWSNKAMQVWVPSLPQARWSFPLKLWRSGCRLTETSEVRRERCQCAVGKVLARPISFWFLAATGCMQLNCFNLQCCFTQISLSALGTTCPSLPHIRRRINHTSRPFVLLPGEDWWTKHIQGVCFNPTPHTTASFTGKTEEGPTHHRPHLTAGWENLLLVPESLLFP